MSHRYNHRSITLESIGAISGIIKNLIKIDTEERIEKSKENLRDYYDQRQALNRRIAENKRRYTELLSLSSEVNFDQSNEKDRVSETVVENSPDSADQRRQSGRGRESQEVIKIEDVSTNDEDEKDSSLSTTTFLEGRVVDESSFVEKNDDADGINGSNCDKNVDVEINCSLCARVEDKICETMMLYRLPQRVINAKTELSLHLRKKSASTQKSSAGSRDTSRERGHKESNEKSGKEKSKRRKGSLSEYRHKKETEPDSKSKSKHLDQKSSTKRTSEKSSNKDGESSSSSKPSSKLAQFLSFTSKSDEKDEEKSKKPTSSHRKQPPTSSDEKCAVKKDHSFAKKSKPKPDEEEEEAHLKQKSRGTKSAVPFPTGPNEIQTAKGKLKRQQAIVKDESKESISSDLAKVKSKVKQKEKSDAETSDYENTMNRILHAKEKIRKEFGGFDSKKEEKSVNRPMMNLIEIPQAETGQFERRQMLKTKSSHLIVDSISTYEESGSLPDNDKSLKTSDTDNSSYEPNQGAKHKRYPSKKEQNEKEKDTVCSKHVSREREKYEKKKLELEAFESYQTQLKAIGHKLKKSSAIEDSMLDTLLNGMTSKSDHELHSHTPVLRRHSHNKPASEKPSSSSARVKTKNIYDQCSTPKIMCPTDSKNNTAVFVHRKSPTPKPRTENVKNFNRSFKLDRNADKTSESLFQVKLRPTGDIRHARRSQSVAPHALYRNRVTGGGSDGTRYS